MARTSTTLVEALLGRAFRRGSSTQPFIDMAYLMVNRVVTCATAKGIPLNSEEAEMLERYLAAHYYIGMEGGGILSRQTGDASITYGTTYGKGLDSSSYGQAALTFDPSGCLQELSMGAPGGFWAGMTPQARADYVREQQDL